MKYVGGKINVKTLVMILCVVCAVGVMIGVIFMLKNSNYLNSSLNEDSLSVEVNQLLVDGEKDEALDLLLTSDLSGFSELDRCLKYFDIISLANELDEREVSSWYELLVSREEDGAGNKCTVSETAANLYDKVLEGRE